MATVRGVKRLFPNASPAMVEIMITVWVMARPLVQFKHNYNYVSRAVMYQWFNKHLKLGFQEPIVEEDFEPLSVEEMTVWDEEHPKPRPATTTNGPCSATSAKTPSGRWTP